MDPIHSLDALSALLRSRIANEIASEKRSSKLQQATTNDKTQISKKPTKQELQSSLKQAIEALDPKAEDFASKASQVFVRGVLLWQFGEGLVNDPRFDEMVDEVQAAIANQPELLRDWLSTIR